MVCLKKKPDDKVAIPIAPMIDCVFLLLIYFMVAATLQKQEADVSFQLPGVVEQDEPLEMPDEQIIEVRDDGQVVVNDYAYDSPESPRFTELASMLSRFKEASDANKVEALVTIAPADGATHQTIIKVMDAISLAGIKGVNFSIGDEF
ncbi:MAG: ExbD/TolR family protein [Puniceicoccales bacterium]